MSSEQSCQSGLAVRTLVLLLMLVAGCRPQAEGPATYPVQGSLTIDGKPAARAQVILHPADGRDFDGRGARPTGFVGEDGRFRLTTYQPLDGAPAGTYRVTIYWAKNPDSLEPSPDRLDGRYLDPAKSKLSVEVTESTNLLPPFELTSSGP